MKINDKKEEGKIREKDQEDEEGVEMKRRKIIIRGKSKMGTEEEAKERE